jgi:hypothetical protein
MRQGVSSTRKPIGMKNLQFPQRFPQKMGLAAGSERDHPTGRKSVKTEVFRDFTLELAQPKMRAALKFLAAREEP